MTTMTRVTDGSLRRAAVSACLVPLGAAVAFAADKTADFISGTYVMEGRCDKLAKLAAGEPASIETVPETLTREGFSSWEGSCTFLTIEEKTKGRVRVARMACTQEAEESEETDTFALDPSGQSLMVSVEGKTTKFVHCDIEKGK